MRDKCGTAWARKWQKVSPPGSVASAFRLYLETYARHLSLGAGPAIAGRHCRRGRILGSPRICSSSRQPYRPRDLIDRAMNRFLNRPTVMSELESGRPWAWCPSPLLCARAFGRHSLSRYRAPSSPRRRHRYGLRGPWHKTRADRECAASRISRRPVHKTRAR